MKAMILAVQVIEMVQGERRKTALEGFPRR